MAGLTQRFQRVLVRLLRRTSATEEVPRSQTLDASFLPLGVGKGGLHYRLNLQSGGIEVHGAAVDSLGRLLPFGLANRDFLEAAFLQGGYVIECDDDGDLLVCSEAGPVFVELLSDPPCVRLSAVLELERSGNNDDPLVLSTWLNLKGNFVQWTPTEGGELLAVYNAPTAAGISAGQVLAVMRGFTRDLIIGVSRVSDRTHS